MPTWTNWEAVTHDQKIQMVRNLALRLISAKMLDKQSATWNAEETGFSIGLAVRNLSQEGYGLMVLLEKEGITDITVSADNSTVKISGELE